MEQVWKQAAQRQHSQTIGVLTNQVRWLRKLAIVNFLAGAAAMFAVLAIYAQATDLAVYESSVESLKEESSSRCRREPADLRA